MASAAFVRVEGVLSSRSTLASAAWLAANAQRASERFTRVGATALALPYALGGDRTTALRLAWAALRGTSEDRIAVLGEETYERHILQTLDQRGLELVSEARRRHGHIVLISDNIVEVVGPLASHLDAELICNRLEFRDGRATGRLQSPVIGAHAGAMAQAWATERGIDLAASAAYGSCEADKLLLAQVGMPCAANPDRGLRRAARELDWPVVEAR